MLRKVNIISPFMTKGTHFGSTEDVQKDREELAEHRKNLGFREVSLDELSENLHGAMYGIGGGGREKTDQGIKKFRVFIRPIAVGY